MFRFILGFVGAFILSTQALATETPRQGELRLQQGNQTSQAAITVSSDFQVSVTGLLARVNVSQTFKNPSDQWVDGVYMFPLPDDAAVDHLTMQVGERLIEGEIQTKQKAKRTFQKAQQQGHKASLVEQQRANLFTNHVANIGPNETVVIKIEYQQTILFRDDQFSLRIPTAITPRYNPITSVMKQELSIQESGWSNLNSPIQIDNYVVDKEADKVNPITIRVHLNAGFELDHLDSPYHTIDQNQVAFGEHMVELNSTQYADRDFLLTWKAKAESVPQAALFTEQKGNENYHLIMMMPPKISTQQQLPRELILVIDTSGSMHGDSMSQAKASAQSAIKQLTQGQDRFNVIEFNDQATAHFSQAQPVNRETLATASQFIQQLRADGGTEMRSALQLALADNNDSQFVRQIVFITDGAVSNESALFSLIQQQLGNSRLFTVGIGSAPNQYFMNKAAKFGRGTFTFIGSTQEVHSKMQSLLNKLQSPVMTNLTVTWDSPDVETWPKRLPDLYANEPLMMVAKSPITPLTVNVQGVRNQSQWQASLKVKQGKANQGIDVRWARAKIESLSEEMHSANDTQPLQQAITDVALKHHLVSQYTSLVAIDKTPSKPVDKISQKQNIALNLPKGTSAKQFFGFPSTATNGPLWTLIMLLAIGLLILQHIVHRHHSHRGLDQTAA